MGEGFLKLMKSSLTEELLAEPACFMLLTQIALRAKRVEGASINGLKVGEALIGDYKKLGLTEQKYRTAKKKLENWGLITTRATNKGTIAKLLGKRVFDINMEICNEQNNECVTTNKKKEERNIHTHEDFVRIGENKCVCLKRNEFYELECKFGKSKFDKVVRELDEKLADGTIKSKNHFITLQRFARYCKEDKIVRFDYRKNNVMSEIKSASFVKKTKEQLYGEV